VINRITMIITFTIKEYPELFTVSDYKQILRDVKEHFNSECSIHGISVMYTRVYYNPELNQGVVDYEFTNFEGRAYIAEMDVAIPNDYLTIIFD